MPLNPRQERFCQLYLELGTARHAYVAAGYRSNATRMARNSRATAVDANASHLIRNHKVRERLQELTVMAANRHLVTVESIAEQLDNDRRLAQVTENAGAAVAASMAKAKLYGLIVNKSESGRPGDFDNMRTTSELIDAVRNELGESYAARLATLFGESSGQTAPDQDTTKLLTFESSGVERTTAISTG